MQGDHHPKQLVDWQQSGRVHQPPLVMLHPLECSAWPLAPAVVAAQGQGPSATALLTAEEQVAVRHFAEEHYAEACFAVS